MRFKRCNLIVSGHRLAIVDQHTHTHAAIGRMQHGVGKQPAGFVAAKNEILKVECSFCGIDHLHSGQEPVGAYRNDAKSGVAVMFARRIFKLSAKPGLLGMSERRGRSFWKSEPGGSDAHPLRTATISTTSEKWNRPIIIVLQRGCPPSFKPSFVSDAPGAL